MKKEFIVIYWIDFSGHQLCNIIWKNRRNKLYSTLAIRVDTVPKKKPSRKLIKELIKVVGFYATAAVDLDSFKYSLNYLRIGPVLTVI